MCQESAQRILDEFNPNVMIAIGGGGFVPARILRTFLKRPGAKNIPIVAIGLSLYEDIPQHTGPEEEAGVSVVRTQWLDFSTIGGQDLIGKRVLIVDEVDDTRTVLPPPPPVCSIHWGASSLIIAIDVELCDQGVGEGCC
jgi:hypoxanthine phosphoribosyltransferase